jgi:Flp pilus assembly protein CpaB
MKGRSLVVVLGLILATLATVGVLAMPAGFNDDVDHGWPMAGVDGRVVVSKVDIPAGTDMDRLIKDDQFSSSWYCRTPWSEARSHRSIS